MPAEAPNPLRQQDIEKVASYVMDHLRGKGPPTYEDCTAFFGDGARACGVYKKDAAAPASTATAGK
jgi:hypothetical protein